MSLYSRAKKGLGILALAGAAYIGSSSLEQRVYAAEPDENIVAAVPQPFVGRTPKNDKEAIEQMYSYSFDHENWAKVVDLGRDNANGYFASLANDKSSGRINTAFTLLKKEYLDKAKTYNQVFGREIDQPFITWTEAMLKKVKDNQLKTYLLMNVVDTTQSLEEFTRRVNDLETRDHELAGQYKIAEKKLNLRLLPGGVEYWLGTATKAEVDTLLLEFPSIHPSQAYSQIPGSGWKTREESVLVGAFELADSEKSPIPIRDIGLYALKDRVKDIASKQGFIEKDLVGVIKEEEWEQAARGSKTKRYSIYGSVENIKNLAEINGITAIHTQLFFLRNSGGKTYLSGDELLRKTPLDRSPYGFIGMAGNCAEITEGEARRALNTTPSVDETTVENLIPRRDAAIVKGDSSLRRIEDKSAVWQTGIAIYRSKDVMLLWNMGISSRAVTSPFGVSNAYGDYWSSTRIRVAFPKKVKEAASTPIAPPNPPDTRTVDPKLPKNK